MRWFWNTYEYVYHIFIQYTKIGLRHVNVSHYSRDTCVCVCCSDDIYTSMIILPKLPWA